MLPCAGRPRLLYLLPAVQVLWVNTHGSFVLQWFVLGCFLAAAVARQFFSWLTQCLGRRENPPLSSRGSGIGGEGAAPRDGETHDVRQPPQDRTHAGRWLLALVLCVAASLLNPYGVQGVLFVRVLASRLGGGETAQFYQTLSGEATNLLDAKNPILLVRGGGGLGRGRAELPAGALAAAVVVGPGSAGGWRGLSRPAKHQESPLFGDRFRGRGALEPRRRSPRCRIAQDGTTGRSWT